MQDEITCEDFVEMAPAYALAAVDEAERMACASHLAQPGPHRGCSEAMAEAVHVTARLSEALPEQAPSPRLWKAIEARITDKPTVAVRRRSSVRELGGWCLAVAVVVVGFYLYKLPSDRGRRAVAQDRGQLMVNPGQRRALVVADGIPPQVAPRLCLWGGWGPNVPTPLASVPVIASDGAAVADLGSCLFGATPPERLVLSAGKPGATSPRDVLLTAGTR